MSADGEDATILQRRARRRLIGSIALVVLVVLVLPPVLDRESAPESQDLVIEIPSKEAGKFNTRVLPPPEVRAPPQGESGAEKPAPQKGEATAAAAPGADAARAKALLEGREEWIVPLGAFTHVDNVKQLQAKLQAAGIRSYTEVLKGSKGDQTRVRAGPFDTKANAEKTREKLGAMGLKPGAVTTR